MVKQRCQPSWIVIGVEQPEGDRISQDLQIVVEGLVERPHDRGKFDSPASLGLVHNMLSREGRTWRRERIERNGCAWPEEGFDAIYV